MFISQYADDSNYLIEFYVKRIRFDYSTYVMYLYLLSNKYIIQRQKKQTNRDRHVEIISKFERLLIQI